MIKRTLFLAIFIFKILIADNSYAGLNVTANWLLIFYKKLISPLQGKRICNFSPTCSQFSRQAINEYGFFPGLIMTSDRLLRCNPSAIQYLDSYYLNLIDGRIFDPPENHCLFAQSQSYPQLPTEKQNKLWFEPVRVKNFADYLYNSQNFARAAAEYNRLYYLSNDRQVRNYAQLMMGESYLAGNEFEHALASFSNLNDSNLISYNSYGQARSYLKIGKYSESREKLSQINEPNLTCQINILFGWSYFKDYNFPAGALCFKSFSNDSLLDKLTRFDGKNLSRRNRLLGTLLSTVIPGVGQIYSGRSGDGLYSFLTIATTATVSYYYWQKDETKVKFSIFAFLTGLFWVGNIYGANIAARDYNQFQIHKYLIEIDEILNRIDLRPDYTFLFTP
jgi:putative membrane protein insertion efficiency factor